MLDDVALTRRQVLLRSIVGSLSFGALPGLTSIASGTQSPGVSNVGPARRVLLVFLEGGPSHIDLFDPKPSAPEHVRGPFGTAVNDQTGIVVSGALHRLSKVLHKVTLVRSLTYRPVGVDCHSASCLEMLTGRRPTGARLSGDVDGFDLRLPSLLFSRGPADGSLDWASSSELTNSLARWTHPSRRDGSEHHLASSPHDVVVDVGLQRAPRRLHERYGRNAFGESALLAARLLASGSRFVQLNWPFVGPNVRGSFDAHDDLFAELSAHSGPMLDAGLSALIDDLDASGLLAETVVVVLGEFGRAPRIGVSTTGNLTTASGRDHWPHCFSALVAGGGFRRGYVHGESDDLGAFPVCDPMHPASLLATVGEVIGARLSSRSDARSHPGLRS